MARRLKKIQGFSVKGTGRLSHKQETHVFLLGGQSNMVGWRLNNNSGEYPNGTLQYGSSDDLLKAAIDPLDHWDETAGNMGLARQFAIDYIEHNPGVTLVFIPRADGGTSFQANHWNPGDTHYTSAVDDTNAVMAAHPEYMFKGVLWHQGESDHVAPVPYAAALHGMMYHMRKDINDMTAATPFILGEVHEGNTLYNVVVNTYLKQTAELMPYTAVVDTQDQPLSADVVHWDGDELDVIGGRYYNALAAAKINLPLEAEPDSMHYLFGSDNPTNSTMADVFPMTDAGSGATATAGFTETDGLDDGLMTQTLDQTVQTQCYVVRVEGTTIVGGTLDTNDIDGSSCYFIAGELRYNAPGLDAQAVIDNTLVEGEWIFIAISEKSGSTQTFRGGEGEHATNLGFTRVISSRLSAIGSVHYNLGVFITPLKIAEYIAYPGVAKTLPELRAIYQRSVARMAARGITLR